MKRFTGMFFFVIAALVSVTVAYPIKPIDIMASGRTLKYVTLYENNKAVLYVSSAGSAEEFFWENEIALDKKDIIECEPADFLSDDVRITIKRAVNITVSVDGFMEKRRVAHGTTVSQLMLSLQKEWNAALVYDGEAEHAITKDGEYCFNTWESEIIYASVVLPFEYHEMDNTTLSLGESKIRQYGQPGEKRIATAVVRVGGEERHREIIEDIVLFEPLPQITDVGIGGTLGTTTDTGLPGFSYVKKMAMSVSAYTAGYESTKKKPGDAGYGITKSGIPVERGVVSVDPKVIPLGTRLYVEGYGYSIAADTGSSIVGNRIDVFIESYEDAIIFGRKNLTVYILN